MLLNPLQLLSQSGGLGYHLKAWNYSTSLWMPFIRELNQWLIKNPPRSKKLVLLGCSAGYCIQTEFLNRYEDIVIFDVDPLAPKLFQWNHNPLKARVEFQKKNIVTLLNSESAEAFIWKYRDHEWLFCNLLGQVPLSKDLKKTPFHQWLQKLPLLLQEVPWTSFHDRFTVELDPETPLPEMKQVMELKHSLPTETLIQRAGIKQKTLRGVVTDHETGVLLEASPRTLIRWDLTPNQIHFIECIKKEALPSK